MPSPEGTGEHQPPDAIRSLWHLKPWWCQPWSILLSGLIVVGASWQLLHLRWLTAGVALAIGAWWLLFLVLVPAAWKAKQASAASLPPENGPSRG
ncbi:MAG: hypothetical protein ER33_04065 [Cyanobium sp. CACIAM 14]|nr:MAG: hypothetical protein ER33_04065 [Cyanobium sp. CACIAM 14]